MRLVLSVVLDVLGRLDLRLDISFDLRFDISYDHSLEFGSGLVNEVDLLLDGLWLKRRQCFQLLPLIRCSRWLLGLFLLLRVGLLLLFGRIGGLIFFCHLC